MVGVICTYSSIPAQLCFCCFWAERVNLTYYDKYILDKYKYVCTNTQIIINSMPNLAWGKILIITSWPDRIVWVVGDPLQFRGGGEGVGDVSKVLQLLDNYKYSF